MNPTAASSPTPARASVPQFHRYIMLTTFRPDGEPVPEVHWFAALNGKLYLRAPMGSNMAERIRRNGRVLVAPTTRTGHQRGLTVVGQARIMPQLESRAAERALDAKYGLLANASHLTDDLGNTLTTMVIEIALDPGPGTEDLQLELLPEAQFARELTANIAIAVAIILAGLGLLLGLRRIFRARA